MPIFFQQQINEFTRLGVWKIEETEEFFQSNVPQHRAVTHPHKRLQHLAGRYLLQYLFPGFPYEMVQIADTKKPFLPNEAYHFSISHCGDYAAAIVSTRQRVGVDVELPAGKVDTIKEKFLSPAELEQFKFYNGLNWLTVFWSAKEAVFKWYGNGKVDFRQHIQLGPLDETTHIIPCFFEKKNTNLDIHYQLLDKLVLSWVVA